MRIQITRSGGFAGLIESVVDVETGLLDPARRGAIEELVRAHRFFELPPRLAGDAEGADLFTYTVRITGKECSHCVEFSGRAGPSTLFLQRLMELTAAN
ncbi:MAG: protealysin inhibitor emfourin [Verrucomicrobiota bacterium]